MSTRKRTRLFLSTAGNWRKRRNKWTKEDKKSRIVLTKSPNFITRLRSLKISDNTEKTSMNWLLLKETSWVHSWSEEMMSLLSCMKKSRSNNQLLPKDKLHSGKDWLILSCSNTKNKIWKDNLKYSWRRAIVFPLWRTKSLIFNPNWLRRNSKSKRFLKNWRIRSTFIDAGILKELILMFTKWSKK